MAWPMSQDYNEAVQDPRTSFADPGLPALNALGIPLPRSGNFADVYEVGCPDGSRWAVKCFTREVPGLRERYAEISRQLARARLPFAVDFTYLEQGVRIRGRWYPVLKMQWVEGLLLNTFVKDNLDRPAALLRLSQIWVRMARRLREAGIAHADLQHGNVILVPGSAANSLALKLIDYDGMFVPALARRKSGEVGHPAYQHPQRLRHGTYSAVVDHVPLLVVLGALRALAVGGTALWERYDNGDNLLFRESDLRQPGQSAVFRELWNLPDAAAHHLVGHLLLALQAPLERVPPLEAVAAEDQAVPLTAAQEQAVTAVLGPGFRPPRPVPVRQQVRAAAPAPVAPTAVATVPVGIALPPAGAPGAVFDTGPGGEELLPQTEDLVARRPRRRGRRSAGPWVAAGVVGLAAAVGLVVLGVSAFGGRGRAERRAAHKEATHPKRPGAKRPETKVEQVKDRVPPDPDKEPGPPDPKKDLPPAREDTGKKRPEQGVVALLPLRPGEAHLWTHPADVRRLAVSPDGSRVVTACWDKVVRLYDLRTRRLVHELRGHTNNVGAVAFCPDGKRAVSGSDDTSAILWDLDAGKMIRQRVSLGMVWFLAVHPNNTLAASAGPGGVLLYDLTSGQQVNVGTELSKQLNTQWVGFTRDGKRLVTAGPDGALALWDTGRGTLLRSFKGHAGHVFSAAISPDGRSLLSGGEDGKVRLWELQTAKEVRQFEGARAVQAVSFSPDGKRVLAAGRDGVVHLWQAETGMVLPPLAHGAGVVWDAAFTPDGQHVVTASGGGNNALRLWRLPSPRDDVAGPAAAPKGWEAWDTSQAVVEGDHLHLAPLKSITTRKAYAGPIKIELDARTERNNIRLKAGRGAEVIFNWEGSGRGIRIHRPDSSNLKFPGSLAGHVRLDLEPDRWYHLSWLLSEQGTEVGVNFKARFQDIRRYDLAGSYPVRISAYFDSAIDVKNFTVTPLR
jgi:hypothetical protein